MISFLSSASAHSFSSLLGSCLMPCIGKLKTKLWRKMSAVGWWHCFGKKKKSLIYRRLHSRLRFNSLSTSNKNENNLLQYREIREEKPHCVLRWKVTGWDSSGGRRYSSKDGERLEEDMEAEQGFCEPGSDYSDPSHCENAAETSSLWGWTWTFCNLWKLRNKLLTDRNQGWCLPRTGTHAL